MPPVPMKVFEFPHPDSPYGLNGVGEPPNLSSTPAIMNIRSSPASTPRRKRKAPSS